MSTRVSRLVDALTETAWALKLDVLESLCAVVKRHDMGVKLSEEEIAAVTNPKNLRGNEANYLGSDVAGAAASGGGNAGDRPYQMVGSVAVIPIGGVIAKYSRQVNGMSQPRGTSLQYLNAAVDAALNDNEVGSIMPLIDSPGGSVTGMWPAMDSLRAAAQAKPMWAYIQDLGASAAYALASQCGKCFASSGATVGSLGVYTLMVDASRAAQDAGYEFFIVGYGANKGAGTLGTKVTEAQRAKVQEEINALGEEFLQRVPLGRKNLTLDQTRAMFDGSVWIGKAAVDKGLIDGNRTEADVLEEMNRLFKPSKGAGRVSLAIGGERTGGRAASGTGEDAGSTSGTNAGEAGQEIVMADKDKGAGAEDGVAGKITQEQAQAAADAAVKAERERTTGINKWAAKYAHVDGVTAMAATAIEGETTVAVFQEKLLEKVAASSRPLGLVGVQVGESGFERQLAHMTTSLVHRENPGLRELFATGGPVAERTANRLGHEASSGLSAAAVALAELRAAERGGCTRMRIVDVVRACVAARDPEAARAVGFDDIELFKMAMGQGSRGILAAGSHTTSDFPLLLANVANKILLARFEEQQTTWDTWCAEGTATDFKDATMLSLSDAQDLKLVLEGEFAKKVTFNERKQTIAVNTYALRFGMTYQMMRNDDLSAFTQIPALFGASAKRLPEILVYLLLESQSGTGPTMGYDSLALIHTTHANLLTGAALSYAAAQAAVTSMRKQVGFGKDKTILNINPSFVIVPPALEFTARLLFQNQYAPGTTADANLIQNLMRPVIVPRLSASATRWWVAGERGNASIEVRFLDGQRTPRIDTITNGNPLEQEFQVTLMGVGVGARNHENIASNAGA